MAESDDATKKTTAEMASIPDMFSFARTQRCKVLIVAAFVLAAITGTVFPAMAFLFSSAFEDIAKASDSLAPVRNLAFSFMVLGVVILFAMTGQAVCIELAALEMSTNLKKDWFAALLRQDVGYYDVLDVAGEGSMITINANKYKKGMGTKITHIVQFSMTFLVGFIYAFWSDWRVSLAVMAVAPLISASAMFFMRMNTTVTARSNETYAKAGNIVTASLYNIRTVLSLNAVPIMTERYMEATQEACDGAASQVALLGLANGCNMGSMLMSYVIVCLFGSYLVYKQVRDVGCDPSGAVPGNERCDPGGVHVFGALMGVTFAAAVLPQISSAIEALSGARVACHPAIKVIQRKVGDASEPVKGRGGAMLPAYRIDSSSAQGETPSKVQGKLEFNNVNFAYPSRPDVTVFKNFNLTVEAGKTVALVGFSGSGKSTAVQLLERFYDPTSGAISLDGKDLRNLNVQWLRQHIAFVQQEPKLFECTIKENIALGTSEKVTDEMIQTAAKRANAHDFIMSFPDGYDTDVGSLGDMLSGGQRQRICIARSLIKEPSILLLDEATSALDSESERTVQEALDKLMENNNMTTIVIAHRLSTIRNADMIAVVNEGTVVETGTHQELLAKEGSYASLVEAQTTRKSEEGTVTPVTETPTSSEHGFASSDVVQAASSSALIQFDNVHFVYPTRPDAIVFQGLNLSVRSGETLALVGPSGCGKSTTIQLLECFYHPTMGSIRFHGIDLKDINVKWLRDEIGLVSQQPILFDCSIEENIKYACPSATHDDVVEVAKQANAHNFITEFPDGYATQVGQGSSLISGGQKQRICIARALLKKPKLLLLDEATSALDSESEKIVQEALDNIMSNDEVTCIVIAHRLSTIRNADRIAVVGHGHIRELGTHDELMGKPDGAYKRLQTLQNLDAEVMEVSSKPAETVPMKELEETAQVEKKSKEKGTEDESEIDKEAQAANSKRARLIASESLVYYAIGGVGALTAGLIFPGWGFVFAFLIEILYLPVFPCDQEADVCFQIWEDQADYMREGSLEVFYGLVGLICAALLGFTVMFWGFGVGSEQTSKIVRDKSFSNVLRQEVGWFDTKSPGAVAAMLGDDAALLHSFTGEPIRSVCASVSSVLVGIVVAMIYMWPVALMTLAILPFMAFGAESEMEMYYGADQEVEEEAKAGSPGAIVSESLSNIRTVASLSLEQNRSTTYGRALEKENKSPLFDIVKKGGILGLGQFVQMWGTALLFWWGSFLLNRFPDRYDQTGFLISMFGLLFSLYGLAIAAEGAVDQKKAKMAAARIFELIDRKSLIDPVSEEGVVPFMRAKLWI